MRGVRGNEPFSHVAGEGLRVIASLVLLAFSCPAHAVTYKETPFFGEKVKQGLLPPVDKRLPENPRSIDLPAEGRQQGKPGGMLRFLIGDQRNISEVTVYGYARLVGFDEHLHLVPDILDHYEVDDARKFTFHLRRGHKWSDGQPFTAEDFRYYFEDVAKNKKLSPGGPALGLIVNGKLPKFEVIDPETVRYTWSDPNPGLLPELAGPMPLALFMPAHYLKQFHAKYADKDALLAAVRKAHVKGWVSLHERRSRQYRPENPDLPMLDPWINTTPPPSEQFIFVRNPYFHRVDSQGNQLPYVDKIRLLISTTSVIAARAAGGEVDLQSRNISFENFTFLKEASRRGDFDVRLWTRGEGAYLALTPNLNTNDKGWRALNRDARFRRALSLAINRRDINRVFFFGLAQESANTLIKESPLFRAEYQQAFIQFDPKAANRLLDEAGLARRDNDGIRLLPDGRRAEIIVDADGKNPDENDILQLIDDNLRAVGIRVFSHVSSPSMFDRRVAAGETVMAIGTGVDNGLASADTEPSSFAPSNSAQPQWPLWGMYAMTTGQAGEAIDDPNARRLAELLDHWRMTAPAEKRAEIWNEILKIDADQVYTIGIVNRVPQPIVVSRRLRNVPKEGIYGFDPGAFFGIYRADTFWFADQVAGR